jgi:TRAP-type C4-dicarboxylate transport system substrate-binding protein
MHERTVIGVGWRGENQEQSDFEKLNTKEKGELFMKRFLTGLILACFFTICGSVFFSCSASDSRSTAGTPEKAETASKKIIKTGHCNAGQEYDQLHYLVLKLDQKLVQLSNGTMGLEIFSDSVLGSERDMFNSVKMGTLDIQLGSTVAVSTSIPQLQIFDMPFLFDSVTEFRRFITDDRGALDGLKKIYENDFNMKLLVFAEGGFRRLMGKGDPMLTIDKIKGKKIRISDNRITSRIYTLLGAIPTNVAWTEVFTAHQQGTIDAGEWPLFSAHSAGFAEVTTWYVFSDIYMMTLELIINKDIWNSLSPEQQKWVQDSSDYARDEQFKMIDTKGEEFLQDFDKQGCKVYRDVNKKSLKDATAVIWTEFRDEINGQFIDSVRKRIDEIRAGK